MNTLIANNTTPNLTKTALKEFKAYSFFDFRFPEEEKITKEKIRKTTKHLARLHREGKVSEDVFTRLVKVLLFSSIVNDMENKMEKKASRKSILNKRFFNYHSLSRCVGG